MATLNTYKLPPSAKLFSSQTQPISTPTTLSFSSAFPSLNLAATRRLPIRRFGAARMSATAAGSYALALADVAMANKTLDSVSSDIEKIDKLFSDPEVLNFFINPTVDAEKKVQVIDEIAKSSALQPYTANFLNILVDAKRMDLITDIIREFEIVFNEMTDTELAVVSSVVNLEPQHLAQIAKQVQKLTGVKNVRVKTIIDPSLVAGFTVKYGPSGSKFIDLSVKKQLEEIARELDLGDIQL